MCVCMHKYDLNSSLCRPVAKSTKAPSILRAPCIGIPQMLTRGPCSVQERGRACPGFTIYTLRSALAGRRRTHTHIHCLAAGLMQGQKLRDLLKKHGDFKSMEVQVRKWHKSTYGKSKEGMWVTKQYLLTVLHWTPCRSQFLEVLSAGVLASTYML